MLGDGDALRAVGLGDQVGYRGIEPEDARGGYGKGGEGYQENLAVCHGGGKMRERTRGRVTCGWDREQRFHYCHQYAPQSRNSINNEYPITIY